MGPSRGGTLLGRDVRDGTLLRRGVWGGTLLGWNPPAGLSTGELVLGWAYKAGGAGEKCGRVLSPKGKTEGKTSSKRAKGERRERSCPRVLGAGEGDRRCQRQRGRFGIDPRRNAAGRRAARGAAEAGSTLGSAGSGRSRVGSGARAAAAGLAADVLARPARLSVGLGPEVPVGVAGVGGHSTAPSHPRCRSGDSRHNAGGLCGTEPCSGPSCVFYYIYYIILYLLDYIILHYIIRAVRPSTSRPEPPAWQLLG